MLLKKRRTHDRTVRIPMVVVVAALLAGCAAEPTGPAPPSSGMTSSTPEGPMQVPQVAAASNATVVPEHAGGPSEVSQWTTFVVSGRMNVSGPLYGPETRIGYGSHAASLFLPPDTVAVLLELVWADPLADLDVEFIAPDGSELVAPFFPVGERPGPDGYYANRSGSLAQPDSPSRLLVDGLELNTFQDAQCVSDGSPDRGECNVWDAAYRTKEGGMEVDWTLHATVFRVAPPPGFSAVTSP